MDATRLEFETASFDFAIFSYNGIDCICPVSDRVRCMREVHRILRPGGVFLVSSHNLIGAIFSGGFFYLTGYRNAIRLLSDQLTNPGVLSWYIRYRDGGGPHYLYSAPPRATVRQLEGAGFQVLEVRGDSGERRLRSIRWRQQHVHFVARKPVEC